MRSDELEAKETQIWIVEDKQSGRVIVMRWTEASAKQWMKDNKPPTKGMYVLKSAWVMP